MGNACRTKTPSKDHNRYRAPGSSPTSSQTAKTNGQVPPKNPYEPLPPVPSKRLIVRALYSFEGQQEGDLRFNKDDLMYVEGDRSGTWWTAEHFETQQRGLIPSNFVVVDDGLPSSLDAWFNITRREAERKLLIVRNPPGTYIVRPCGSDSRVFALSVRSFDEASNMFIVKHFKIRTLDNQEGYYINPRTPFTHIKELIQHYSGNPIGISCMLTAPYPREYKPPVQVRNLEITRQSIKLLEELGRGSFGRVHKALLSNTLEVAVKLPNADAMNKNDLIEEASIMHQLHHEKIVQILAICTEPPGEPVYIISELMEKGALLTFLKREGRIVLKHENLIDMMAQICEGMAYLESKNFVHRDLRAANILVGHDLTVKVADFGLARVIQAAEDMDAVYMATIDTKFPVKWTAPEASVSHGKFTVKSDVWSFGIVMYEILTYGGVPYPNMNNRQVVDAIAKGYRMPRPQGDGIVCSQDMYEMMLECWKTHPEERPTFDYLKDVFDQWTIHSEQQYVDN